MQKKIWGRKKRSPSTGEIIVVSGLPRSGTSMMMKMLAAGGISSLTDNIRVADKDNPQGYYEFERVKKLKEGDHDWLKEARGKAVKVIATLLLYLPVHYPYRVIFMQRDMDEILASQRQMLIRRGEDPDKISDAELAGLFKRHLLQVDGWVSTQSNIQRLDISYNHLLDDPRPDLLRINQWLGDQLDIDKMVAVIDPGLYRQRNP